MTEIRKAILIPDRKMKPEDSIKMEVIQASMFLDMYNLATNFNTLPLPGGLLAQDSLYMHLARYALMCLEDKRQLDEAKRRTESA